MELGEICIMNLVALSPRYDFFFIIWDKFCNFIIW